MKAERMMQIGKSLAAVLLLAGYPLAGRAADDFETFRSQQQQGAQKMRAEFQQYKEQQDREFADFLKSQWREFDTFRGKVRIKEPKPKQIPVVPPPVAPVSPIPLPAKPVPVAPPVVVAPPVQPLPPSKPVLLADDAVEISFYGNPVDVTFDPQWKTYRLSGGAKPEAMSNFWGMMSGSKYAQAISAVDAAHRDLKLDDWGHVALWRAIVQALQPGRRSEQNLLLWFFLIKSGYDARLGYADNDVHLFVAVKQQVFATKFTKVGTQVYYAVLAEDHGDSIGSFYTYEAKYPVALKPLDIGVLAIGFTKPLGARRELSFDYQGRKISFSIPYDRRLVEYMGTFPQTEFELYFDTDASSLVRKSLLVELKKFTTGMSEEEALDFLLAFVQKSFAYKTDEAQFGYEKYFFVEESLYFPYNDCEDRAVMYAWLVHELLGVRAIGLLYPGHMTTAVATKQIKAGFATVDYQGERFVIADPTYIGASLGMAMPSYAQIKPKRMVKIELTRSN